MGLTGRRMEFLVCLARLCQQSGQPVHYALVAQELGVSKFTAYDRLRELLSDGYLTQAYELPTAGRPGRSLVLFAPTLLGWQTAGLTPPASSTALSTAAPSLGLASRAALYKERLRRDVLAQLARGSHRESQLPDRNHDPSAAGQASQKPAVSSGNVWSTGDPNETGRSANSALISLQHRLQQAREPLAIATYTLGLWIARLGTQRPDELRQTLRALLLTPLPRPDLSLAGIIGALATVLHRPQTADEVRRLQGILAQVTRDEAAWLLQFVKDALTTAQIAPA
ncbi:MAG: hypothetical protein IMX01_07235 [Limnochordaceae bacterium]|nr:hypothetical protein [Limnochordaceae bacterium]